jgi:hypothetical protein
MRATILVLHRQTLSVGDCPSVRVGPPAPGRTTSCVVFFDFGQLYTGAA